MEERESVGQCQDVSKIKADLVVQRHFARLPKSKEIDEAVPQEY